MKLDEIQPIPLEPLIFINSLKTLIVADLHIGIEGELQEQGLNPPYKTSNMVTHFFDLCSKYKPEKIFLLGDVKHNIPTSTVRERIDIRQFLNKILSYGEIHIIPGNHDGNIDRISPSEIIIHPSKGFIFENIGFVHGHRWPSEEVMSCEQIIMGHTHPTVMFTDRRGYQSFESCWVRSVSVKDKMTIKYPIPKKIQFLIMPAFNPLCGGIAVNKNGVSGPLGKIMDIKNAHIYLLDGTSIGKVRNI